MIRPSEKWVVAASVAFGSLMATIDTSIVNVAIPVLRGELGASIQEITWVSAVYMVAMVLVMPLTGFLGATFGQKRLYLASLVLFVVGSALCGTARSLGALATYRAVQGLGGGALQPTQQAILRQTFPPHEQGMAMALFTMVILIGPALGPVMGGWITDNFSWPWIFYINLPIGLLGIVATWRNVHEPEDLRAANRERAATQRRHFDWAGIALIAVTVAAVQYLVEQGPQDGWFDSDAVVAAAFIAAFGLAAFVIRELTATAPVVNLRLFREPTFTAATVIATITFALITSSMFLLPVFMQELQRLPATTSGIALLPRSIAMFVLSPLIGRLYNWIGPAIMVGAGVVCSVLGAWQLGHLTAQSSTAQMIVPFAVTGAGTALMFVPLATAALSAVPRPLLADAAGLTAFTRQIGGSIGLTLFATLFTHYGAQAHAALAAQVTILRPEVAAGVASGGLHAAIGTVARDSMVLAFDRTLILQAIALLFVVPLILFLRERPRAPAAASSAPAPLHLASEP